MVPVTSRLEGNTYSLLDTERLLIEGNSVDTKSVAEAQMILNHKDAIEFIVGNASEIGVNRYTITNLHAMLAHNLLSNDLYSKRWRTLVVIMSSHTIRYNKQSHVLQTCVRNAGHHHCGCGILVGFASVGIVGSNTIDELWFIHQKEKSCCVSGKRTSNVLSITIPQLSIILFRNCVNFTNHNPLSALYLSRVVSIGKATLFALNFT